MATAIILNPDDIKVKLEFTMSLGDWKQIRKTLDTNAKWAELQIIGDIRDIVQEVEKTFYVTR